MTLLTSNDSCEPENDLVITDSMQKPEDRPGVCPAVVWYDHGKTLHFGPLKMNNKWGRKTKILGEE